MDKNEYISKFDSLILNPVTRKIYGQQEFFNVGYWLSDTEGIARRARIISRHAVVAIVYALCCDVQVYELCEVCFHDLLDRGVSSIRWWVIVKQRPVDGIARGGFGRHCCSLLRLQPSRQSNRQERGGRMK